MVKRRKIKRPGNADAELSKCEKSDQEEIVHPSENLQEVKLDASPKPSHKVTSFLSIPVEKNSTICEMGKLYTEGKHCTAVLSNSNQIEQVKCSKSSGINVSPNDVGNEENINRNLFETFGSEMHGSKTKIVGNLSTSNEQDTSVSMKEYNGEAQTKSSKMDAIVSSFGLNIVNEKRTLDNGKTLNVVKGDATNTVKQFKRIGNFSSSQFMKNHVSSQKDANKADHDMKFDVKPYRQENVSVIDLLTYGNELYRVPSKQELTGSPVKVKRKPQISLKLQHNLRNRSLKQQESNPEPNKVQGRKTPPVSSTDHCFPTPKSSPGESSHDEDIAWELDDYKIESPSKKWHISVITEPVEGGNLIEYINLDDDPPYEEKVHDISASSQEGDDKMPVEDVSANVVIDHSKDSVKFDDNDRSEQSTAHQGNEEEKSNDGAVNGEGVSSSNVIKVKRRKRGKKKKGQDESEEKAISNETKEAKGLAENNSVLNKSLSESTDVSEHATPVTETVEDISPDEQKENNKVRGLKRKQSEKLEINAVKQISQAKVPKTTVKKRRKRKSIFGMKSKRKQKPKPKLTVRSTAPSFKTPSTVPSLKTLAMRANILYQQKYGSVPRKSKSVNKVAVKTPSHLKAVEKKERKLTKTSESPGSLLALAQVASDQLSRLETDPQPTYCENKVVKKSVPEKASNYHHREAIDKVLPSPIVSPVATNNTPSTQNTPKIKFLLDENGTVNQQPVKTDPPPCVSQNSVSMAEGLPNGLHAQNVGQNLKKDQKLKKAAKIVEAFEDKPALSQSHPNITNLLLSKISQTTTTMSNHIPTNSVKNDQLSYSRSNAPPALIQLNNPTSNYTHLNVLPQSTVTQVKHSVPQYPTTVPASLTTNQLIQNIAKQHLSLNANNLQPRQLFPLQIPQMTALESTPQSIRMSSPGFKPTIPFTTSVRTPIWRPMIAPEINRMAPPPTFSTVQPPSLTNSLLPQISKEISHINKQNSDSVVPKHTMATFSNTNMTGYDMISKTLRENVVAASTASQTLNYNRNEIVSKQYPEPYTHFSATETRLKGQPESDKQISSNTPTIQAIVNKIIHQRIKYTPEKFHQFVPPVTQVISESTLNSKTTNKEKKIRKENEPKETIILSDNESDAQPISRTESKGSQVPITSISMLNNENLESEKRNSMVTNEVDKVETNAEVKQNSLFETANIDVGANCVTQKSETEIQKNNPIDSVNTDHSKGTVSMSSNEVNNEESTDQTSTPPSDKESRKLKHKFQDIREVNKNSPTKKQKFEEQSNSFCEGKTGLELLSHVAELPRIKNNASPDTTTANPLDVSVSTNGTSPSGKTHTATRNPPVLIKRSEFEKLNLHKLSNHSKNDLYEELQRRKSITKCICGAGFIDMAMSMLHRSSHNTDEPLMCAFCGKVGHSWMDFYVHLYNHNK